MVLSTLDIQNKTFHVKRFRGYNMEEVDEFLQIVINDYDELQARVKDQEREIKSLTARLEDFDTMKESLNKSILVAQDTAETLKTKAESDASQITDSAYHEARQILQSSYDEARRLINESDELKKGLRSYYQRVTMLLEGQLANIKTTEWEEALKPSPIYVGDSEEKLREILEHTSQTLQPMDETGQILKREGKKEAETLESFAQALSPSPEQGIDQVSQPKANQELTEVGRDNDRGTLKLGDNVNIDFTSE